MLSFRRWDKPKHRAEEGQDIWSQELFKSYGFFDLLPEDGFGYYAPFGREAVEQLFQEHRVGSMETASVTESLQGQGIGQELTRHRIRWISEAGVYRSDWGFMGKRASEHLRPGIQKARIRTPLTGRRILYGH
jgi:GNAT superfamily N-acetyltransferase